MILAYDSNVLDDDFNVDDQFGDEIDIPTIILTKDVSDVLREHLLYQKEDLIMTVFFQGNQQKNVEMSLFYRSDDPKIYSFFREFYPFKLRMKDKLTFDPIFKYSTMFSQPSSDELNENIDAPCIKDSKYCSSENYNLKIYNGRKVLFENLRQACIYKIYGIDTYWEYMVVFFELCLNSDKGPSFNEECSKLAFNAVAGRNDEIGLQFCLKEMITERSKVEEDYNLFNRKKIFRVPTLLVNGVRYKGLWLGKSVFSSICDAFIQLTDEDGDMCSMTDPNTVVKTKKWSFRLIIFVSIIVVLLMVLLLFCYRRFVNRSLEFHLMEKIQELALKRINQYKAFKDEGGSSIDDFFKKSGSTITPSSTKLELEETENKNEEERKD
ncbi:MAG: hypothetical protein MJ252_16565 [archaeon]|nr:hypothetical protein [archaeon]